MAVSFIGRGNQSTHKKPIVIFPPKHAEDSSDIRLPLPLKNRVMHDMHRFPKQSILYKINITVNFSILTCGPTGPRCPITPVGPSLPCKRESFF